MTQISQMKDEFAFNLRNLRNPCFSFFVFLRAFAASWFILIGLTLLAGCGVNSNATRQPAGLTHRVPVQSADWMYGKTPGHVLTTAHYRIFTTLSAQSSLFDMLPQLLEGAYTQYRLVAPDVPPSDRPMDCYIFAQRAEWVAFTRANTGARAGIYLQIASGAYALNDVFVAYDIGSSRTLSVAAHEGWHQFASRHFKSRLPAFLEEGTATLFEGVKAYHSLPRWNLKINPDRAQGLRNSIEGHFLFPLSQLMTLDAGEIIHRPGDRIDAFYSQNWAFARFLFDGDGGEHRPQFQKLLADVAAGTVWGTNPNIRGWPDSQTGSILSHYLNMSLPEMDTAYQAFCHRVAFDDYMDQFK